MSLGDYLGVSSVRYIFLSTYRRTPDAKSQGYCRKNPKFTKKKVTPLLIKNQI
jgi:hypothetical protein